MSGFMCRCMRAALAAACTTVVLAACLESENENPNRPKISYKTPLQDTVGFPVSYPVVSTRGEVAAYDVQPRLPEGLHLDPLTGLISGTLSMGPPTDYAITAYGPGGQYTTTIRLEPRQSTTIPPRTSYGTPWYDTVGQPFSRLPVARGGVATSYAIEPLPPTGISFDTLTGRLYGIPVGVNGGTLYRVITTGPGGRDTTSFTLRAVPYVPLARFTLGNTIVLEGIHTQTPQVVANRLRLAKMIVHISSSKDSGFASRDTIVAGLPGFSSTPYWQEVRLPRRVFMAAETNPEYWVAAVSIRDAQDREVYKFQGSASCSKSGECAFHFGSDPRPFPLKSYYMAAFQLPDVLKLTGETSPQSVRFNRLQMSIDGIVVADSVALSHFPPNATAYLLHAPLPWVVTNVTRLTHEYVPLTVKLSAYGRVGSGSDELLFEGQWVIQRGGNHSNDVPEGLKVQGALNWVGSRPYSGTLPIGMAPLGPL